MPVQVRSLKSARRLRLRFDEARGTLKLTCPWRMSRAAALKWALDQREWIEAQLAAALPAEPFEPGARIIIEGRDVWISWDPAAPRSPMLEGSELRLGGPEASVPRRVETYLKRLALDTMSREVAEYAAKIDVTASAVTIGDAGTRWGSCSSRKRIRLSWRLIFAPASVRRYVVAHEVAHLVHLDHSPEFKSLEARLFGPGLPEAKATLGRIGPRLRRIGRRS